MSLCIVNVGGPNSGKTTWAIGFCEVFLKEKKIREIIANDVQMEFKYRTNKNIKKYHGDFEGFITLVNRYNVLGSKRAFIWDEAADYCPHGQGLSSVKKVIRAKRFSGNLFILNFHELMEVPNYIIRFADYFSIGVSAGDPVNVQKKYASYPHVYKAWDHVLYCFRNHGEKYKRIVVKK